MQVSRSWWSLTAICLVVSWCGCAKTIVQPKYEQRTAAPVLRPGRVIVYEFSVTAAEVTENQGFFMGLYNSALSDTTENERERAIGRDVRDRMSEELVAGIRDLGLPAQRVTRGTPLPPDAIAVTGLFLNVDEGNRLQRSVIGFGAGGSQVDAQVEVYAPSSSGLRKLLEFNTHSDSGRMPGAAVSAGVGAAASGGMTAGSAAANVGSSAVKGYRTQVDQMAGRSADQAVAYLSEFFARQGWIPQEKVIQAKRAGQ